MDHRRKPPRRLRLGMGKLHFDAQGATAILAAVVIVLAALIAAAATAELTNLVNISRSEIESPQSVAIFWEKGLQKARPPAGTEGLGKSDAYRFGGLRRSLVTKGEYA